jgi:hypothetical protein
VERLEYNPEETNIALILYTVRKGRAVYLSHVTADGQAVVTTEHSTARLFFTFTEADQFLKDHHLKEYFRFKQKPLYGRF